MGAAAQVTRQPLVYAGALFEWAALALALLAVVQGDLGGLGVVQVWVWVWVLVLVLRAGLALPLAPRLDQVEVVVVEVVVVGVVVVEVVAVAAGLLGLLGLLVVTCTLQTPYWALVYRALA